MGEGFQFIDIILFAMIAAFLILRLRSVLGRHKDTGEIQQRDRGKPFSSEDPDSRSKEREDNVISLPDPNAKVGSKKEGLPETPLDAGVRQIQTSTPDFDTTEFLVGARTAFEMIVQAFAEGDEEFLETLLNQEVYNNFRNAILSRKEKKQVHENTLIRIVSGDMIEAFMSDTIANITVKIISEQINVTRNAEGAVVEGHAEHKSMVTDIWTFARDTGTEDPNWQLVATRSLD
jgi:predicted lipid-binding transport protein (Tim44 family)